MSSWRRKRKTSPATYLHGCHFIYAVGLEIARHHALIVHAGHADSGVIHSRLPLLLLHPTAAVLAVEAMLLLDELVLFLKNNENKKM